VTREGPESVVELSSTQKGILFHALYAADSPVYRVQSVFTIEGEVDVAAFQCAWQRVVDRHQALRCSFFWEGLSVPVQAVHRRVDFSVGHVDYSALDPAEREQRLVKLLAEDRSRPFDLLQPPQMRVTLVRVGVAQHELVWTRHHVIFDGWSQALLLQELFRLYELYRLGEADDFDEQSVLGPPTLLAPYSQWVRQSVKHELDSFWRPYLQGFTEAVDIASRSPDTAAPARQAELSRNLSEQQGHSVAELARRWAVTTSTMFVAAWALVLSLMTGRRDIVFGLTLAGRPAGLPGVEQMIGMFINTLPIRVQVDASAPLETLVRTAQEHVAALTERQHTPLVDIQGISEIPSPGRLLGSALVVGNYPTDFRRLEHESSLAATAVRGEVQNSFPITLRLMPGPTTRVALLYDESAFGPAHVTHLLDALLYLIASFGADGHRTVGAFLDELSEGRRSAVDQGALDGEKLLPRGWSTPAAMPHAPPITAVERTIAHVWGELLSAPQVGLHDDFFALGGHSLLAIRCVSQLRTILQTDLPLRTIFEAPVLQDLAAALVESDGDRVERAAEIYLEVESMSPERVAAELEGLQGDLRG